MLHENILAPSAHLFSVLSGFLGVMMTKESVHKSSGLSTGSFPICCFIVISLPVKWGFLLLTPYAPFTCIKHDAVLWTMQEYIT